MNFERQRRSITLLGIFAITLKIGVTITIGIFLYRLIVNPEIIGEWLGHIISGFKSVSS